MTTGNAYQVPTLPIPPAITDQESGGSEDEWGGHAPVPAFSSRQSSAPEEVIPGDISPGAFLLRDTLFFS